MWVELVNKGDWGATRIHLGKNGPAVPAGPLKIQWPDDSVETLNVYLKKVSNSVDDMGHSFTTLSEVPYVMLEHFGAEFEMPLHKLGVKAWRNV